MPVRVRISLLCATAFLGMGCLWLQSGSERPNRDEPQTGSHSAEIRTDVNGLMNIVRLEYEPVDVTWQEFSIGDNVFGPADYFLKAVLIYDPEIVMEIRAAAVEEDPARQVAETFAGTPFIEAWFPDSVLQHLVPVVDEPGILMIDVPTYDIESLGVTAWADGYFFIADDQTIFLYCNTR